MTTSVQPVSATGAASLPLPKGLNREALIRAFRLMYLSRALDDREMLLKRQSKIFFQISGAGHEAIQIAAGMVLRPGVDWVVTYYRDRALALTLGETPEDMLLQALGAGRDPNSGGRQMPSHWTSARLNMLTPSSSTGTQFLHAAGLAQASRYLKNGGDEVALVCSGDGATSEGEFWECMNVACLEKLPLLVLIEDNGYAISVPVEHQTAGGNIAHLLEGFPGLLRLEVDGTDFAASYETMLQAMEYCRSGHGPALVRASVVRPYSHSFSEDEATYKPKVEREAEALRDPLKLFPEWLMSEGFADRNALTTIMRDVDVEVQELVMRMENEPAPDAGSALRFLYSPEIDPCSTSFQTEPEFRGPPRAMIDSVNQTMAEEMRHNPRMLVFGEDVADCSRDQYLGELTGKGGVFKATTGLQREFGSSRCFNTPLAEASIVGRAIGLAARGLKPVVEIQFFDYIWPAMMQIRGEMANFRWRSNNAFSCPVVVRVPIGGYLKGGAIYHSQCGEVTFTHIPGLRVIFPSNALDACGLLRTAIRCDDPVLFLEHKKLYRELYNRSPHPGENFTIPFGKAKIVKMGQNLTIVSYGALVQKALQAAVQLEQVHRDVSVEVIDLRSLSPYDWPAIAASVKKTSRVMIAHEDTLSFGYGAEIAARIASELFGELDAPVGRVAALDTWVAYNPQLEDEILPQVTNLVAEGERLLRY